MSENETILQAVYEYEFGPYVLRLQHHNHILPGILLTTDEKTNARKQVTEMTSAPQACRLLVYLLEHRASGVDNSAIIKHIWQGQALQDESKSLGDLVRRLRDILGDNKSPYEYIQRGDGKVQFIYPVKVHYQQQAEQHRPSALPIKISKFSTIRARHVRSKIMFALSEVHAAVEEEQWDEVLQVTDALFETVEETSLRQFHKYVSALRLFRLVALGQLTRFDDFFSYLTAVDIDEICGSVTDNPVMLLYGVGISAMAFERARNPVRADEFRSKLWSLVADHPREYYDAAVTCVRMARSIATLDKLFARSIIVLDDVLGRIKSRKEAKFKALRAEGCYWRLNYQLELGRDEEAVGAYHSMEEEFRNSSDEDTLGYLVWAGTEATRALRKLGHHGDADVLANSLAQRFEGVRVIDVITALAWASLERYRTFSSSGDFEAALDRCTIFINKWDTPNLAREVAWPVANAYANRALFLRRTKRFAEAVAQCDFIIERFGNSEDANLQFEVAWTLVQKSVALRKSARLAVSVGIAKEVITRFGNAKDERIVDEVTWAIHAQGNSLLCEAKFLRQNGMYEEGDLRLREAQERFTEAAERTGNKGPHLACRSYAEFLLAQKAAAEQTFAEALVAGNTEWLNDEWAEVDMFPIPDDSEFQTAVQSWLETHPKGTKSEVEKSL
jgi:DNA-binding winged helix-turn-helix (wHTH) protein/tetratricopeptide (TPR) repeat protein